MTRKKRSHLDKIMEWQRHQYDPGHYTGGKLDPALEAEGNPKLASIWWFVQAGIIALIYIFLFILAIQGELDKSMSVLKNVVILTVFCGVFIFSCVWIGIRFAQKAKRKKAIAERRKMIRSQTKKKRKRR